MEVDSGGELEEEEAISELQISMSAKVRSELRFSDISPSVSYLRFGP